MATEQELDKPPEETPPVLEAVQFDDREPVSLWQKEWAKLDEPYAKPHHECKAGCGHSESAHMFSTVTVDDCANNCQVCHKRL